MQPPAQPAHGFLLDALATACAVLVLACARWFGRSAWYSATGAALLVVVYFTNWYSVFRAALPDLEPAPAPGPASGTDNPLFAGARGYASALLPGAARGAPLSGARFPGAPRAAPAGLFGAPHYRGA
jgi:hypothetical protein